MVTAGAGLASRIVGIAAAGVLFLIYLWLGWTVSPHAPAGIDLAAGALFGAATPLAAALTYLGRFPPYATECAAVLIAGFARRAWLGRAVSAVALLIVAEVTSDAFKLVFHRPRPAHWLVTHETSYSYASGHATNSLVFFGFWAYVTLRSTLPVGARTLLVASLFALSAAIGWSRLALGAHYATDVLGGYLLGAAILELGIAVIPDRLLGFERLKSPLAAPGKSFETVTPRA